MKIRSILFIIGVTFSQFSLAQQTLPRDPDCCTSIMVGKLASTDGSVMTSHTCDSWYRTWVNVVPAADFANDTVMNIYDGRMHTESVNDQTKLTVKGQIPQAKHTLRFFRYGLSVPEREAAGHGRNHHQRTGYPAEP